MSLNRILFYPLFYAPPMSENKASSGTMGSGEASGLPWRAGTDGPWSIRTCLEDLERLWEGFDFPVCRSETDTLAKEHLFSILDGLAKEAGELEVGRGDVMGWLAA